MFAINVRKLFRKAFGPSVMPSSPRLQPCPTFRPSLERLESRVLLSASPLVLPTTADAPAQMTAMLNQFGPLMTAVQNNLRKTVNLIAQEVSYVQQQWADLLSILAIAQAQSLGVAVPQASSGTTIARQTALSSPSIPRIKPQGSDGPYAQGMGGYLWDPVNGTNASDGHNWDYNGFSQKNAANPKRPGDTNDPVTFDPDLTQAPGLNKNGASAITWDYTPAIGISILLGTTKSAYTSQQTINSGIAIDAQVNAQNTGSDFNLKFTDGTSKWTIDGNSTITNMHLGGDKTGQFLINSATTTIAQSSTYTELEGVAFTVGKGATLSDRGQCPLKFWNSSIILTVQGEMDVYSGPNATNTLIDINGNTNDYIDVTGKGALLSYLGNNGIKDTFTVPVLVENSGFFWLLSNTNGWLIVQGNLNGAAPGVNNNASVYMKDTASVVALTNTSTLECDGHYYQAGGTLESGDATVCTLQDGPAGALGTATIAGGSLAIDFNAGGYVKGSFGFFNINCNQLDFNGTYQAHIAGNASGPLTNDVLTINQSKGTLNLQGGSVLTVFVDNPPVVGQQYTWPIIKAGKFPNPQFNTTGSVPNTPGLKYGPAGANEYDVTF